MDTADLIDTYSDEMSEEQEAAFRMLMDNLLAPGSGKYTLQGYAGTGKTYIAARVCEVLRAEGVDVVAAAPTHRATSELRRAIGGSPLGDGAIPTHTVASLLGLQLKGDGKGGYHLVPDGETRLPDGGVVICDEGSMVGEETMGYIEASQSGVRWLFLGDPAQLPPVGEDPSAVFDLPGAQLTEIVRQARDNPIIEFTRRIRMRESHFKDDLVSYDGDVGVAVTRSEQAFLDSAVGFFGSNAFQSNPHTARLLAYRNRVVDQYNATIRRRIYGDDSPTYVEDEWLMANESWAPDTLPVIINSELLQVIDAEQTVDELGLGGQWQVWRLTVKPENRESTDIIVLADEDAAAYRKAMKRFKSQALTATREKDRNVAVDAWEKFYALKEQYAQVGYAYATTVHKSQGGTFNSVFVDYRDLDRSREPERNALKYVAGTRPRKRLALLV